MQNIFVSTLIVSTGSTTTSVYTVPTTTEYTGLPGCYETQPEDINAINPGILVSPNYPNNYDNSMSCLWTLETIADMTIQLNFIDFDLETKYVLNMI